MGVGVSSFSAAGNWPAEAEQQHGVDWKFLYLYVVPTSDPKADVESFLLAKASLAQSLGAIPVYTFYELLQLGQQGGHSGTEPEVVKATLADPALMKQYFDNFVFLLETAEKAGAPTIVHVEPDSWGFMMWAMGVEGNADATSIPVAVASSGHRGRRGVRQRCLRASARRFYRCATSMAPRCAWAGTRRTSASAKSRR